MSADPHAHGRDLLQGVREIRRAMPPTVPLPGRIARTAAGVSCLAVDADDVRGWPGWDARPTGHVLAPFDVMRRRDGHDVLFPLCTERVEDFVVRRGASAAVTAGEAVTLAVSILRGVGEVFERRCEERGEWWLTDAGRPVFAHAALGDEHAPVGESSDLLGRLAEGAAPSLGAVLAAAREAVRQPRALRYEAAMLEERLFAEADALPLQTTPLAPARARVVSATRVPRLGSDASDAAGTEPVSPHRRPDGRRRPFRAILAEHVDDGFGELVARMLAAARRTSKPAPQRRRRLAPWLVAGAAGAVVVLVGVLWTPGGPAPGTARVAAAATASPAPSRAEPRTPSTEAVPSVQPQADAAGALVGIVDDLLDRRRECGGVAVCLASVQAGTVDAHPNGAASLPREERRSVLLDDLGGVAVFRVERREGEGVQFVVIERDAERWRLRDVFDPEAAR